MLTMLKNVFRRHKVVQLSNGKWVVFVRGAGITGLGWKALDKNDHNYWHHPAHIKEWCLFNNEEDACFKLSLYLNPPKTITDEIKAHL